MNNYWANGSAFLRTFSLSQKTQGSLLTWAWREIALLRSYFLHITKTGVS